ncbi:hypothetical protein ACGRHY_16605 [Streptomyces sp. HK10]|uniref:sodium:solute symporter family transporter n=1 Tax=Streptomyces sp. HK10 TaxID=3373255 RepID=UPI003747DBA6
MILAIYFLVVLGVGFAARRSIKTSLDFFLSGRSLPAWVTGLAFIAANLGALEILGMAANGAQYGVYTVHWYWVGAIPAMVFLGLVMMPFYYGSRVRSVPEFLLHRFGPSSHLLSGVLFSAASVLIAGVNLYALAIVLEALLGWPQWVSIVVSGLFVLLYITLGGLSSAIYNEVVQFFVILAGLIPLTVLALVRVGGWSGLSDSLTASQGENFVSAWGGTGIGSDNPLGANFVSAIVAFVVGTLVVVVLTPLTRPRPVERLAGLVYGTRSPGLAEPPAAGDEAWYRRPALLGWGAIVLAALCYIPFSF